MLKIFRSRRSHKDNVQAEPDPSTITALPPRHLSTSSASDVWHRKRNSTSGEAPTRDHRSSDSSLLNPAKSRSRSRGPSPAPIPTTLGLSIVHQPERIAPVDIIFVHGLGGDSRATWSKDHNPGLFWPELWLPFDRDIGKARILTFGYDATFRVGAPKSISNISDFAKELLFGMAFGKDKSGQDLGIGNVPIIFVAHSMGGLVAKKAYLLGQNDGHYQHIVQSISAMVFLATPHRGTDLAQVLDILLRVSFQSSRSYIKELKQSSSVIEDLNEQFRHVAPRMSIFTFYEMLATNVAGQRIIVLNKESAILGYGEEISKGLNADHHDVCKYSSTEDPNYISVRDALKTLVGRLRPKGGNAVNQRLQDEARDVEKLFAISSSPEDDFTSFRSWWLPGTCGWFFSEPAFQSWLQDTPGSRVLWFNAPPASGKSILSTCVISHLHGLGRMHQYFFFKFSNQSQRSLSAMLRSIACQAARDIPDFRRSLIELSTEGLRLEKADSTVIWHRIFESILFELDFEHPLFWIIDGLDESDSPKALLELLRTLPKSRTNIRVLIVSRKTEPLSIGVERLSGYIPVELIDNDACDHHSLDIRKFVEEEIKHMRGSDELKQRLTQSIMDRSGGNFLWVRLVLEEILKCHTENSIQETLDQIPEGMNSLYQHMELGILNNQRKSDRILAKSLFQWTICAQRPLTLKELSQALRPENPEFLDLRKTIQDVCGQFILVGQNGQVGMVHQTARDYLTTTFNSEISIDLRQAHEHLFKKTVTTLLDPRLRLRLTQNQHALQSTNAFVFYASISWAYHLRHSRTTSDEAFDLLVKLLKSPFVLTWIHSLALAGRLEILVEAAKALNNFAATTRKINVAKNPLLHRLSDLELLNLWAIDLVKVVGKFSRHLVLDPSAIYRLIPPFCPENSILHQQFHQPELAEVSVSGISNYHWNDNLARITVPGGDQAWNIACAGPYIAVLGAFGTIFLWNSYNFTEICALRHNEPVTAMGFNKNGSKLVTYGLQSTKLWSIPSGQVLASTPNPAQTKAMAIVFAENDTKALIGSDDKVVRYIRIDDFGAGWQVLNAALLREVPRIEGTVVNSPMCIAFNGDATQVGVSYRGFPLSVWEINEARCIGRCRRAKEPRSDLSRPSTGWFAVDRFTWNPVTGHIIGIYKDGCIFKWHPVTNENQEVQSTADEVAASPDGKLFVTSDSNGTIRVWNFAHFSIIYQLSSADLVTGLAFSPDCRRFYDLRGSCLNAWESNSLIRFSETEESFSDTGSDHQASTSVSQASEAYLVQYEAVTALAIPQNTSLYCVGNEEGVVNLFNAATGESIELTKFWNFLSVSLLAWSQDATHIAATDLGGEIVVKRLTLPDDVSLKSGFEIKSMPSPKLDLEGRGIHQLLFSYDSKSLLVICEDQGQIWSIDEGTLRGSVALTNGTSRKWLNHPTQTHLFLGFGTSDVEMFQWHDFAEQNCLYFHEDQSRVNGQTTFDGQDDKTMELRKLSFNDHDGLEFISTVNKAILTQDEKHLLLQIKHTSAKGRITKSVIIFDSSAFDVSGEQKFIAPSTYFSLPVDIMGKIEVPLDILTGFRFIFLDQDLWICTLNLRSMFDEEPLKRHYFIPRDWASTDSLEQCCVMKDGTFLSPREDKVAVIRNSLEVAGF